MGRGAFGLTMLATGLGLGAAAGFVLGSSRAAVPEPARERELAALREELRGARDELDRARAAVPRDRAPRPADEPPLAGGADAGAASSAAGAAPEPPPAAADDPGARAARVAQLVADAPVWFERGDGRAALAALRELASLAPEGRDEAMRLALAINADVSGEGKLRLSDVEFYTGLADDGIKRLMDWALPRDDTPAGFRSMAAWSLPWTQAPEATVAQFASVLATERDAGVQRALVTNLGRLRNPAAERALADILGDAARDPGLRAQAASELALTQDEGIARTLEVVARDAQEPRVRDAAHAALIARDPPATGFLVTGTAPSSQAETVGLRAGDILVTYGGRSARTLDALREAQTASAGEESVPVVVVRDGAEVTLLVRPGQLGVFGRNVEASQR